MSVVTQSPDALMFQPSANGFGATIMNCNLNESLTDAMFDEIHRALLDYQVLVFKGVRVKPDAQVALARLFGHVQVHVMNQYHNSELPELYTLSNLDDSGQPSGRHPDKGTLVWHTDGSWMPNPGLVTMMFAEEVPVTGGETHFCDMYSAWESLSLSRQQELMPLRATHSLDFSRQRRHGEQPMTDEQREAVPPVTHPLVCRHPETSRACVYLGDHAESIEDMPYDEGRHFIDELNAELAEKGNHYQHRWEPDELVIWDNRCVLHKATPYDTENSRRVIRRCTVLRDDVPVSWQQS